MSTGRGVRGGQGVRGLPLHQPVQARDLQEDRFLQSHSTHSNLRIQLHGSSSRGERKLKSCIFVGLWYFSADKLCFVAGFYKPTMLRVYPPICWITAGATMPGFAHFLFYNFSLTSGAKK